MAPDTRSWIVKNEVCKACGYNVIVTQAVDHGCDYWYYCSNKQCDNHHPGDQVGDMEEVGWTRTVRIEKNGNGT